MDNNLITVLRLLALLIRTLEIAIRLTEYELLVLVVLLRGLLSGNEEKCIIS